MHYLPGRLLTISASLLFLVSNEVSKWQCPINAANEKLAILATAGGSPFRVATPLAVLR
jgi:hypothetical protein